LLLKGKADLGQFGSFIKKNVRISLCFTVYKEGLLLKIQTIAAKIGWPHFTICSYDGKRRLKETDLKELGIACLLLRIFSNCNSGV